MIYGIVKFRSRGVSSCGSRFSPNGYDSQKIILNTKMQMVGERLIHRQENDLLDEGQMQRVYSFHVVDYRSRVRWNFDLLIKPCFFFQVRFGILAIFMKELASYIGTYLTFKKVGAIFSST